MNAPTSQQETTALALAPRQQFDLSPRNFDEAWRLSDIMANSDLVPKDFKGKPENCFIAIQWGAELGLKAMQGIQNIAIINGRPSLWGDAMLGIVRASPLCEYVQEGWLADGTAFCKAKRRGEPEQERTFSDADAKQAGLAGKQGPWTTGPKRMKQMRARAWALRDVFTDVLRGMAMAEEAMDMPAEKFMGPADVVKPASTATTAAAADAATTLPEMTSDDLAKREAKVREFYGKGKSADDVIAFYALKFTVPAPIQKRIREMATPAAGATVTDAAPKVTFATVADRIHKAQNADELADAGTLIGEVADEQQRRELSAKYASRADELAGKD